MTGLLNELAESSHQRRDAGEFARASFENENWIHTKMRLSSWTSVRKRYYY
jgi:hypothetical protein